MKKYSITLAVIVTVCFVNMANCQDQTELKSPATAQLTEPIVIKSFLVRVSNDALYENKPSLESIEKMTILKLTSLLAEPNQAQIVATTKSIAFDRDPVKYRYKDRTNMPLEKQVTGRDVQPYTLTDYQWVQSSVNMVISNINLNQQIVTFHLTYMGIYGYTTKLSKQLEDIDVINESTLELEQDVTLTPNKSKIVAVTGSKDETLFLIMNASLENEQ